VFKFGILFHNPNFVSKNTSILKLTPATQMTWFI